MAEAGMTLTVRRWRIAGRALRNHRYRQHVRVLHAQRGEDVLPNELFVSLTADFLDEIAEQ